MYMTLMMLMTLMINNLYNEIILPSKSTSITIQFKSSILCHFYELLINASV